MLKNTFPTPRKYLDTIRVRINIAAGTAHKIVLYLTIICLSSTVSVRRATTSKAKTARQRIFRKSVPEMP